ncbi:hypothetical protein BpHYR1_050891, partial [Brachionus plicatilis]
RPLKTASALKKQPNETHAFNAVPKGIESSESDVEEEEPVPKRARLEENNVEVIDKQAKLYDQCGAQMKKKRYWAYPKKYLKN